MTLRVEEVSDSAAAEWDSFVKGHTHATPYHLFAWRSLMQEAFGHRCHYLVARGDEDVLRGVLPLVSVRSFLFGRFMVSMPFLNYGAPIGDDEAVTALTARALKLMEHGRFDLLELRSAHALPLTLPVSHRKITVVLPLPAGDPTTLWDDLKAKVRSQVRRPMKEGVEVRFGPDQLGGFYAVFARHMRDLGTPVLPREFFEGARERFTDAMWFACAYLDGRPVAAGSGFRWASRFELVWASALVEYNRLAPNMLLYWRFIEECAKDGASLFDFGRCTEGSGTHRFKQQWGGHDEQLWWYQGGPKAGGGTPTPDSGPYSFGPRVWARLPLSVANAVGPHVVKYLP